MREIFIKRKKELGLTFLEISKRSNLPLRTIENIFSGARKTPRIDTVIAICKALEIDEIEQGLVISNKDLTQEEIRLLRAFSRLSGSMKEYIIEMIEKLVIEEEKRNRA